MKYIFTLLLFMPFASFSQKVEQYCEVIATAKLLSNKVTININKGEFRKFFSTAGNIKEENGKLKEFNSLIDALNYLGKDNWKLVNAFPVTDGGANVYHYVFKKEFDLSELSDINTSNK